METLQVWASAVGAVLGTAAAAYAITAYSAERLWRRRAPPQLAPVPPITILKPLCGAEPELYEGLRSFCLLKHPQLQIICGVRDPHDPALDVVRRLQREFPQLDLKIVADPTQHGSSGKISNLVNMMALASYDYLVVADSDVRVPADYLGRVVLPLADPGVGIVTCPYRACPRAGLWSLLGSLFVNEWFMPAVRVGSLLGSQSYASGVTIALRRDTLTRIGGFAALAEQLPDDYRLGQLTRQLGLRTVLSELEVETSIGEGSLAELARHELRWLRTIRTVQPLGYAFSGVTFALPVALLGALLAGGSGLTLALLAITAGARLMVNSVPRSSYSLLAQLWLVALNDLLAFALWCWSFTAREVQWGSVRYRVARDGSAREIG